MNVRHTTAPWKATGYNVHTGGTVAFCQTNCPGFADTASAHEMRANASLIAAAPDLLAALCSLRDAIIEGDSQEIADALHRDALPAIAKASGS